MWLPQNFNKCGAKSTQRLTRHQNGLVPELRVMTTVGHIPKSAVALIHSLTPASDKRSEKKDQILFSKYNYNYNLQQYQAI